MSRSVRLIVMAAVAALVGLTVPGSGAYAQNGPLAKPAPSVVSADPLTNRCTTPGHSNPCWATTQNAGDNDGAPYGCPLRVPLFLRAGGVVCIGGNDLVEIQCWFTGAPAAGGESFQDHVDQENAGGLHDIGHIPDHFVNLGNHNPNSTAIRIPQCG